MTEPARLPPLPPVVTSGSGGAVWHLTLPATAEGLVALGTETLAAVSDALGALADEPACRVLVLRGTAGCFCRGMDLGELAAGADADALARGLSAYAEVLLALRRCRALVIAAVDGATLGGGVGLAAAADTVLATRASTFGLPEVTLGLLPGVVLPVLAERVGAARARRLALRGSSVDAEAALGLGLVDELCADAAELERAVGRELRQARRAEPGAVARIKQRFFVDAAPLEVAVAQGREQTLACLARPEVRQAIAGFVDGSTPPWFVLGR